MAAKKTPETAIKGIHDALLSASKNFPEIGRDKVGNWGTYGSLPGILRAVQKPLADAGVTITQPIIVNSEGIAFQRTVLTHAESGEMLTSELPLPIDQAPQKIGAVQTYYRRYLLQGLLALAPDDIEDLDDLPEEVPEEAPTTGHLESLRDLSLLRAQEAWGNRKDIGELAKQIRKAASQLSGISKPQQKDTVMFAAAIQALALTVGDDQEPLISMPQTGPDPLLEAVSNGEIEGKDIPITPIG